MLSRKEGDKADCCKSCDVGSEGAAAGGQPLSSSEHFTRNENSGKEAHYGLG